MFQVALVGSIYMVGLFFGSFFLGQLADWIGRRPTLALSIVVGCGSSLLGGFAPSYAWYCVARFFSAIGRTTKAV